MKIPGIIRTLFILIGLPILIGSFMGDGNLGAGEYVTIIISLGLIFSKYVDTLIFMITTGLWVTAVSGHSQVGWMYGVFWLLMIFIISRRWNQQGEDLEREDRQHRINGTAPELTGFSKVWHKFIDSVGEIDVQRGRSIVIADNIREVFYNGREENVKQMFINANKKRKFDGMPYMKIENYTIFREEDGYSKRKEDEKIEEKPKKKVKKKRVTNRENNDPMGW